MRTSQLQVSASKKSGRSTYGDRLQPEQDDEPAVPDDRCLLLPGQLLAPEPYQQQLLLHLLADDPVL